MPPAGYKRSRALWDETRRPDASWHTWVRAMLYELQPVRYSKVVRPQQVTRFARRSAGAMLHGLQSLPGVLRGLVRFGKTRTRQHWIMAAVVVAYYYFVRWMHELLDAGPLVIIMTSLALIFTVGLGDTANPDGLSAYSVFNRGFQQLMGSVDVDSLLAQHVGGGLGAAGAGGGAMGMPRAAADDDHEPVPRAARRPLVRREPDNHHQEEEEEDRNEDEDDDDEEEEEAPNNNNNNNNRARKSGKKARRRNLDQRRDIRQQREAAMALGMQGGDGPEDQMAIQRLLEEQIAADNQNGNH